MVLQINGRVISKKNSKRVFARGRRMMVLPSKRYIQFEKDAVAQIAKQVKHGHKPFDREVCVDYCFMMKGRGASDFDNMEASINDILQKAGILTDDKLIMRWSGRKLIGWSEYLTEVNIEYI